MADPLVDAATSLLAWCDGSGAAPAPMVRALRSALADRSHVSRLEESLRVALEARAEAVEVLRKVEWDGALDDFVCPSCSQTRPNHFHDCRLSRAIGKGE